MSRTFTRVRIHEYTDSYTRFIFNHTYRIGGYRRVVNQTSKECTMYRIMRPWGYAYTYRRVALFRAQFYVYSILS